ncbi:MAG: hypothetical protein KC519_00605 [Anaerolineae bacterium]|nr:hypothetical protein [Anaerolineae bacterium]
MTDKTTYACPRCQIGHLHRSRAAFVTLYRGMPLSIPNMDSWTCDICQYQEFDYDALNHLEQITGQLTAAPEDGRAAARSAAHENTEINSQQRLKP